MAQTLTLPRIGAPTTGAVTSQTLTLPTMESTTPDIEYTPGGARFTPFTGADFIATGADEDLDAAALEAQIQNDLRIIGLGEPDPNEFQPIDINIAAARDARTMEQYNEFLETEIMRIDQVVGETVGDNWQGSKTVGPMSFNVSDGLARRRTTGTFADREAYFKKHHPEGTYSRIPTGGGKFAEVYSITKGGDVFAVDPTGFSDTSNEIASITGNLLNFTTAGSVVGSLFSPFYGTAIGATLGNLVDQAVLDETSMTQSELIEKLSVKDAATIGLIDGLITKILPVAGGKFKQIFTGVDETGSILARKTGERSLLAQKSAERLGLPLFSVAQLSDSQLVRGTFSQTAGTSNIPGRLLNNQQRKLYEALKQKAESNFDSFNARELSTYTKLQQDAIQEEIYKIVTNRFGGKLPDNMSLEALEQNIRKLAGDLQTSHNELIDEAYKKAFNTSGAQNVVFNLTPAIEVARKIQQGTQIRTRPKRQDSVGRPLDDKGRLTTATTTRAQGELSGELQSITNALINIIDPTVSKLVVKDGKTNAKTAFDSLTQLKALRDRASKLIQTDDSVAGRELVEAIDDVMNNPTGGSKEFLTYYNEAKALAKLKAEALNASNIASMFSRKSEVMPNELAQKFWEGKFTSRDWDYFTKLSRAAAGNKPEAKIAANQLIADVQDGFITWLYQNPAKTQDRIRQIMDADNDLFVKMVPDAGDRAALENLAQKSAWVQSDGVQKTIGRQMTVGERALTAINEMNEAEIINFVNKNGGINGPAATNMRAAVFKKILAKNMELDDQALETVNPKTLAQDFMQLSNFRGDYEKLRPLFQSSTLRNDNPIYDAKATEYIKSLQDFKIYSGFLAGYSPDVGGPMQAGAVRAGLSRLDFGAYRTVITNNILASIFASPPSVKQLEKLHGFQGGGFKGGVKRFWNKKSANVYANILGQLGDSFSKDVETPKEEVERTGQPPEMGDQFSAVTTPAAPTQVVSAPTVTAPLPPPIASAPPPAKPMQMAGRGTGITNFSSLFPQDELGGAIANRRNQGIMGIV
jgi:hypothetical protein